jgi:uncharacterized protein (DUF927 family)
VWHKGLSLQIHRWKRKKKKETVKDQKNIYTYDTISDYILGIFNKKKERRSRNYRDDGEKKETEIYGTSTICMSDFSGCSTYSPTLSISM